MQVTRIRVSFIPSQTLFISTSLYMYFSQTLQQCPTPEGYLLPPLPCWVLVFSHLELHTHSLQQFKIFPLYCTKQLGFPYFQPWCAYDLNLGRWNIIIPLRKELAVTYHTHKEMKIKWPIKMQKNIRNNHAKKIFFFLITPNATPLKRISSIKIIFLFSI